MRRNRGMRAPILLMTSAAAGAAFSGSATRAPVTGGNRPDYKVSHSIDPAHTSGQTLGKRGFKPDWLTPEVSPITIHTANPGFECQGNKITSVSTAGQTMTGPAIETGAFEPGMIIIELNNQPVNPDDPSVLAQLNNPNQWMTIKAVRIPPGYRVAWDSNARKVYYLNDTDKTTSYNPPPQKLTGSGTNDDDDSFPEDGLEKGEKHETTVFVHVNYTNDKPRLEMIDGHTVRLFGYPSMTVQMLKWIVEDTLNDAYPGDGEDIAIQAVAKDDYVLPDSMVCLNSIPEGAKLEMYGVFGPQETPQCVCTIL